MVGCSQVLSAQSFHVSILAGVSTSQVSGDRLGGFDKAGIAAGGEVYRTFGQKWNFGFEILYVQKGSRKPDNSKNGDYTYYRLRLNYIEIPVIVRYLYSNKFSFEAAPSFGRLLFTGEEDESGPLLYRRPFNNYEFGIGGGFAYHFNKQLALHIRVSSSVVPVRKHQSGQTWYLNRGQYNEVLLFAFRYEFRSKPSE